jgi:hypothetical protein
VQIYYSSLKRALPLQLINTIYKYYLIKNNFTQWVLSEFISKYFLKKYNVLNFLNITRQIINTVILPPDRKTAFFAQLQAYIWANLNHYNVQSVCYGERGINLSDKHAGTPPWRHLCALYVWTITASFRNSVSVTLPFYWKSLAGSDRIGKTSDPVRSAAYYPEWKLAFTVKLV